MLSKKLIIVGILLMTFMKGYGQLEVGARFSTGGYYYHVGDKSIWNSFDDGRYFQGGFLGRYELIKNLSAKTALELQNVTITEYIDVPYRKHHLLYFTMPLALEYHLFWGIRVDAGYQFNYLLKRWLTDYREPLDNWFFYTLKYKNNPAWFYGVNVTVFKYVELGYQWFHYQRFFATNPPIKGEYKHMFYFVLKYPLSLEHKSEVHEEGTAHE
ncbi:MAG: hypothetical protein WHT29_00140 [Bacteroidales bacterium]